MSIVRAPGVSASGAIGIRGWRGLCSRCLWLGPVGSYDAARRQLKKHRRECCKAQS